MLHARIAKMPSSTTAQTPTRADAPIAPPRPTAANVRNFTNLNIPQKVDAPTPFVDKNFRRKLDITEEKSDTFAIMPSNGCSEKYGKNLHLNYRDYHICYCSS